MAEFPGLLSLRSKFDNSDSKFDVFCAKVWGFPAESLHVEFELERYRSFYFGLTLVKFYFGLTQPPTIQYM